MSGKKILKAIYYPREVFFKIPKNIDLEDKSKVEEYWVKWNMLFIKFIDGTIQKIECCQENDEEYKHPENTEIKDKDDYGWFSDSEEEEEDKDEDDEEEEEENTEDLVKQDTLDLVNNVIDSIKWLPSK